MSSSSLYYGNSNKSSISVNNSNNEMSEDRNGEDSNKKQMQLNLRISTTNDGVTMFHGGASHVSKVLIQNYSSFADSSMSASAEESLKMSLSNLRLEGFV